MGNRGFYGVGSPVTRHMRDVLLHNPSIWVDMSKLHYPQGTTLYNLRNLRGNLAFTSGSGGTFWREDPWGLPSLEIGQSSFQQSTLSFGSGCTIVYVARPKPGGQSKRVLASSNVNWLMGYWNGYRDCYYAGSFVLQTTTPSDPWPRVYTARQATTTTFWRNTTQIAQNGNATAGPGYIQIGGLNASGGATEWSNFYFYELITFGYQVTDEALNRLQLGLMEKWGIV